MKAKPKEILVVDDDESMQDLLQMRLQQWGYNVIVAPGGQEASELIKNHDPDLVISDVVMPDMSGMDLIRILKAGNQDRSIILITGHASIDMAVEAMKRGAQDFITKPVDFSQLKASVEAALKDIELRKRTQKLSAKLARGAGLGPLVGVSKAMREIYRLIKTLGGSDVSAIIIGESGTGKELAARLIHDLSPRAQGPFIAINAAAIPENLIEAEIFGHEKGAFTGATTTRPGCFELANGGTLFLDEIAEMPSALQPKLLRVLQDGRVRRLGGSREFTFDVRVIAATNQVLQEAIQEEKLREDLYYRLSVFTITLPALRERKKDIPLLVQHFIDQFNRKHQAEVRGAHDDALELLEAYDWPGNVRELRNVIERAIILTNGEWIEASHLPQHIRDAKSKKEMRVVLSVGMTAAEAEREYILKTLESVGNNKSEAARRLGVDAKTIYNKLKEYGVDL